MNFVDLIEYSRVTLIGYDSRTEGIKDELISEISFNRISDIDSSFNIINCARDIKINTIFAEDLIFSNYFLIDYNDISLYSSLSFPKDIIDKNTLIRNLINSFRNSNYRLIITNEIYKSIKNDYVEDISYRGGASILYECDIACHITNDRKVKLIKNRFGNSNLILEI